MNNNGKRSEWSQWSAAPTTGGPGAMPRRGFRAWQGHFQCINICILCNYWTSVNMKHSARHYIFFFFFFVQGGNHFFFWVVPGGNRECWAAPPGAAHRSYNPDVWYSFLILSNICKVCSWRKKKSLNVFPNSLSLYNLFQLEYENLWTWSSFPVNC